jgi:hypothetical protein
MTKRANLRALVIHHLAQFFAGFEKWNPLRGNVDALPCLRISAVSGMALSHTKAPKTSQFHFVSLGESVGDTGE